MHEIYKQALKSFAFYALAIELALFYTSSFSDFKYSWMFISSPHTQNNYPWIMNAWPNVLAIHGTILALTITFMSQFIDSVSKSISPSLIPPCKKIVLQQYNILQFSIDGVFGLIFGIFFLCIGGGIIPYATSISLSICFIFKYTITFKSLYKIMESGDLILPLLNKKTKELKDKKIKQDRISKEVCDKFFNHIKKYEKIITPESHPSDRNIFTRITPINCNSVFINGYNKEKIGELNKKLSKENCYIQIFDGFFDSNTLPEAYVRTESNISNDNKKEISSAFLNCFNYKNNYYDKEFYNEITLSLIDAVYFYLLSDDKTQLTKIIDIIANLYNENDFNSIINTDILKKINKKIALTKGSKNIDPKSLSNYFKYIFDMVGEGSARNKQSQATSIKHAITVPLSIYNHEEYNEYINNIFTYIEMQGSEINFDSLLDVYCESIVSMIEKSKYNEALKLSEKINKSRVIISEKSSPEEIKSCISAINTIILYGYMRVKHLLEHNRQSSSEYLGIIKVIKIWLSVPSNKESIISVEWLEFLSDKSHFLKYVSAETSIREIPALTCFEDTTDNCGIISLALYFSECHNEIDLLTLNARLKKITKKTDKNSRVIANANRMIGAINDDCFIEILKSLTDATTSTRSNDLINKRATLTQTIKDMTE